MFAFKAISSLALLVLSVQGAPLQKRSTSGRGTFYDVGMGNCGWSNSASEKVVALNTAQYGSTSQVSGSCGKMVTIHYNGKSIQAKVVDSCPTCPYGGLDMSTSLFSELTGGNMGLGVIQVTWDWGSGSSSSSSSSSNSKSNENNNDSDNKSSSSKSSATPTPSATSSSSSTSTPTATTTASGQIPTGSAQKTVDGVPQWWETISSTGCSGVAIPEGVASAAIAPSSNAEEDDLQSACGKWVEVTNPANKKTTKVIVSSFLPGTERNGIYMADGYKQVADMNGDAPSVIDTVKWGFIN